MTEQNRPRHARDSDEDSFDNSTYDDAYSFPEEAAGTAGAAGAASTGAGGAGGAGPEKSGPPLRGFAMILTAVAVVLIIWGAFSLFNGGDDDKDADTVAGSGTPATTAPASPGAPDAGEPGATAPGASDGQAPAGGDAAASGETGEGDDGAPADRSGDPAAPEGPEGQGGPAAPGAPAGEVTVNRGTAVTVLNNSKEKIGQSTADDLEKKDWTSVSAANLAGNVSTYQSSAVYYPAGDAQAKADAEALASDLGISAVERTRADDDNFAKATDPKGDHVDVHGVVVVLTEAP